MSLMPPGYKCPGPTGLSKTVSSPRGNLVPGVRSPRLLLHYRTSGLSLYINSTLERSTLWPDVLSYEWLYSCVDSVF